MKKTKEIRWLLMGRTVVENGIIRMSKRGEGSYLAGGNGVFNAMAFGVARRKRCFRIPDGADGLADGARALTHMGREVALQETPGVKACLCRNRMSNQKLYTADITDDGLLELSVFMGRELLGFVPMWLSLHRLCKQLPEVYEYVKLPKEVSSQKQRRMEKKAARRRRRWEKKQRRKDRGHPERKKLESAAHDTAEKDSE